jgi:hypothetical protein
MSTKIFVNLPVTNLDASKSFFANLGFAINPQFTDETAACVVISDDIFAMLLTHLKFKQFTSREIADAHKTTEVLTCLSCETREKVDQMVETAIKSGGAKHRDPQDHGFMYERSFCDPDGHIWELVWMNPVHIQ